MLKGQAKILAQSVYEAVRGKNQTAIDKIVNNFFHYLREHRLRHLVPEVLSELEKIYFEENNITRVQIHSKNKLDEALFKEIINLVKARSKKEVMLRSELDPDLIGGATVRYDDKLIDLSFKKQLSSLAKKLSS